MILMKIQMFGYCKANLILFTNCGLTRSDKKNSFCVWLKNLNYVCIKHDFKVKMSKHK